LEELLLNAGDLILTINGGSSSIKFAVYGAAMVNSDGRRSAPSLPMRAGKIERIGLPEARFVARDTDKRELRNGAVPVRDHLAAGHLLIDWLETEVGFGNVIGVGHRVVHGGPKFSQPQQVSEELLKELHRLSPYDPEHLPAEIELIELFAQRFPNLPQVACFDTAFHREMPLVARILPIPRRFFAQGIQRYGFHGISYEFLMEELARVADAEAARGRVIIAHLGNGASLAAVKGGKGIDTSMGFTPTAGIPMSSRSGDLDPGLVSYLAREEGISPEQFQRMVNKESGLLGVSEISPDMRDLLAREASDARAAEAVALFCYQIKKWIGSFAAALGGLDTLVFAAGIGENVPLVRARICDGLDFLGIRLDEERNKENAPIISSDASRVTVRVIRTDEEAMMAKAVRRVLQKN
jgi:acetate kinase